MPTKLQISPAPDGEESDLERDVSKLCEYLSDDSTASTGESPISDDVIGAPQYAVAGQRPSMSGTEMGHRRMGRPVFPQDFLNIPPPQHPPDTSPTAEAEGIPMPPQRKLPPLPHGTQPPLVDEEEPHYEEARPPPKPRPSKRSLAPSPRHQNGYELSDSNARLAQEDGGYMRPEQRTDWGLGHQILEQTETGSFYIPSGHTTMSSLSPQSQKLHMAEHQNKHNYSLLPTEGTTVPVPVMPMRPEMSSGNLHPNYAYHAPKKPRAESGKRGPCAPRTLAALFAALFLLSLAVIAYLLVSIYGAGRPSYALYSAGPSLYSCGGSSVDGVPLRPLPESFSLGDPVTADLPPGQLAYTSFALQSDSYVQFNLSLPPSAKLGLYGRQTLKPTPTQHSFAQILIGDNLHSASDASRTKRAVQLYHPNQQTWRSTVFIQYLLAGKWNLGFLNDGSAVQPIRFAAALTDSHRDDCKYGCYGVGTCKDGKCYCFRGFTGAYCEESLCPVLCSGNGLYVAGQCHCHQGWKGLDCDVPAGVCVVADCGGRGQCGAAGECVCESGWGGKGCGERTCADPTCSGRGHCAKGFCFCEFGWKGPACADAYTSDALCDGADRCGAHGRFSGGVCSCDRGWSGEACQDKVCLQNCGEHGHCVDGACVCKQGWTGNTCVDVACPIGCEEHGVCEAGTCVCEQGWNGDGCQLEGCPNDCNSHGECRRMSGAWRCACSTDFAGGDCSVPLELRCDDDVDNDGDGLKDCEDSECCGSASCLASPLCHSVPNPHAVLIREQPPPPQASFYQKMKFLVEPDSVQQYPDVSKLEAPRVAVVRGRVVNAQGGALIGVRVTDKANALFGFTITRGGGMFDFVLNGGGSVTLQFMRQPFRTLYVTIPVAWNRIIRIPDVVMVKDGEEPPSAQEAQCDIEHGVRPTSLASWRATRFGSSSDKPLVVIGDAESVHAALAIPATASLRLHYSSADAAGAQSTLRLFLVPDPAPARLRLVMLRIDIEGNLVEETLEAKANLSFSLGWDKRNVYKQKVYGLATASVAVGYVYKDCPRVFWERSEVELSGFKAGLADVGGWRLGIHHHLDILNGVLEKGDGSAVFLRREAHVISTTLGNSHQRPLDCPFCNSPASQTKLFEPVALAAAPDGSLFIGDHNLIRRLSGNGTVTTVLQLSPSDTAHRYYLAVEPLSGALYVSLPLRRQIWRLRDAESAVLNPEANFVVVVGTTEPCRVGDNCGDGGPGETASLTYPKGIVFDSQGGLYMADQRSVRYMSVDGVMSTVVSGGSDPEGGPLPCDTQFGAADGRLSWPTQLALDPLNDRLTILDGDLVFQLDGHTLSVVLGMPPHCAELRGAAGSVRRLALRSPRALAVDGAGSVLVAESDGRRLNRVRGFAGDGTRWWLVAGKESKCDCHPLQCPCGDDREGLASQAHLHSPVAFALGPDGRLHIADQGNLRIRTVGPSKLGGDSRLIQIPSPASQELYLFNRFGQHMATQNLLTGGYVFNFTYHSDSSYGRLVNVMGSGGQKIYFIRDSPTSLSIETTQGRKSTAEISVSGMLSALVGPDGGRTAMDYDANTGLLVSLVDAQGRAAAFAYDYDGHLVHTNDHPLPPHIPSLQRKAVSGSGEVLEVETALVKDGLSVRVTREGRSVARHLATHWELLSDYEHGSSSSLFVLGGGWSVVAKEAGWETALEASPHPLLSPHHSTFLKLKLSLQPLKELSRPALSSRVEWRYYIRREGEGRRRRVGQVGRKTRVNGVNLLTIEYDRNTRKDVISQQNGDILLSIHYNNAGSVSLVEWGSGSDLSSLNLSHDALGQLASLRHGRTTAHFLYDRFGRLTDEFFGDADEPLHARKYGYETDSLTWPSTVQIPSGPEYQIAYDSAGRLSSLQTAMGEDHSWRLLQELGITLLVRRTPLSATPFVVGRDEGGAVLLFTTPEPLRRLSVTRASDAEIRFHGAWTESLRSAHSQLRNVSIANADEGVEYRKTFTHQGPLVAEIVDRRAAGGKEHVTHWSFEHDELLRVVGVAVTVDEQTTLQPTRFTFEPTTARLARYKDLALQYSGSKVRMLGSDVVREWIYDSAGRVVHSRLLLKGRKVAEHVVERDALGRVTLIQDSQSEEETRQSYNVDGRLSQLSIGEANSWSLHYDLDGRLKAQNDVPILVDARGLPSAVADVGLEHDDAGSIQRRGDVHFGYDGFGRLSKAWKKGGFSVLYVYDEAGRLVSRISGGDQTHFHYAIHPARVSHIYDSKTKTLAGIDYDPNGQIHSIERSGDKFFVSCHPDGTPVKIFGLDGEEIKSLVFGPTGQLMSDSNSDFRLHFGWRGELFDPSTGVTFVGGRAYDALVGRWMSVTVASLSGAVDAFLPESVDPLRFPFADAPPSALAEPALDRWLSLSGVEMGQLLPLLSPTGLTTPPPRESLVGIGLREYLAQKLRLFRNLLSEGPSPVLPPSPKPAAALLFAPGPSTYGPGLLLSNHSGSAVLLETQGSAEPFAANAVLILLNQSRILPVADFAAEVPVATHFFWKAGERSLDLEALRLTGEGGENLTSELRLTAVGSDSLLVSSDLAAFRLFYGGTEEAAMVSARVAILEASKGRWWEAQSARNSSTWSEAQRSELASSGRVAGLTLVHSAADSQLLLSDPARLRLAD